MNLRWIIRMVDRPKGMDDGFFIPPLSAKMETRVLQYSEIEVEDVKTDMGPMKLNKIVWYDVPIERHEPQPSR